MKISTEQTQGTTPVTILRTEGDLDASSYQGLIAQVQKLYQEGVRNLIVDMSSTPFMSSAGIVSLHAAALIMRGERPPDPDSGWEAFHAIDRDIERGKQQHIKLLNPQPRVERALEKTGLKQFFEIYTNEAEALASFK